MRSAIAFVIVLAAATPAAAQGPVNPGRSEPEGMGAGTLDAYRRDLQRLAADGGWWFASNAAHAADDGGIEAYGTRYWVALGGVSANGCLWSIRDGRPAEIHWHFVQGWDGARGGPFFYQTHSSGGTGMGAETGRSGASTVMEQEFWWPDGSRQRIRHHTEWLRQDAYTTRSAAWVDGGWRPNRSYLWERQPPGAAPCGPGSSPSGEP